MNKIVMWVLISLAILLIVGVGLSFVSSQTMLKKPAIYIYPLQDSLVQVQVDINGQLTQTIPKYNGGWVVDVTKEGIIEDTYDYLFYEADLNKLRLPNSGWIVKYENLPDWFDLNLIKLGLNEKEKNQFKEYWLGELPQSPYYELKLLDQTFLRENMNLLISPLPDTMIRLNFHFKPLDKEKLLDEPTIVTPERSGFTVVEWGGILDN